MMYTSSPGPGGSDSGLTSGYGLRPSNGAIAGFYGTVSVCQKRKLLRPQLELNIL